MTQSELLAARLDRISGDALRKALAHAIKGASGTAKYAAKHGNRATSKAAQKTFRELDIIVQTAELLDKS